jgi:flagellar biosynthesis protein FlhB
MRRRWTLIGIGATAELLALALWAFVGAYQILFWPFLLLSIVAGLAGAWLVLATMFDLTFHRPRGQRLRPVRGFDLVLGAGLFVLALLQLRDALGQIPA